MPFATAAANGWADPVKCGEINGYGVATRTAAASPRLMETYAVFPIMTAETHGVDDPARRQ